MRPRVISRTSQLITQRLDQDDTIVKQFNRWTVIAADEFGAKHSLAFDQDPIPTDEQVWAALPQGADLRPTSKAALREEALARMLDWYVWRAAADYEQGLIDAADTDAVPQSKVDDARDEQNVLRARYRQAFLDWTTA